MNVNLLQELLQAIIAEFKKKGICKVEITLSGAESAAGTTKDYALLAICNDDESIYNYVLRELEKCKWPKDLLAVFDLLKRKKLLSSSDKYNGNIISMMLEHAPNYRGKRSIHAVQDAFQK